MKINKEKWKKFINDGIKYSIDCGVRPDDDELMKGVEMSNKEVYSYDGEYYKYNQLSDVLDHFDDAQLGDIVTVYEAELEIHNASFYLPDLDTEINEKAWDMCGDAADSWPDLTRIEEAELHAIIDKWFDSKNNQPSFGTIENVKELKFKVTDLEDVDKWELINEK